MNPDKTYFTWKCLQPSPILVHLDFFLISASLFQLVSHADILPSFKTDHYIPTCSLVFSDTNHGLGYWKYNVSLLQDQKYLNMVNNLLDIELAQEYDSYKTKWEINKCRFLILFNYIKA